MKGKRMTKTIVLKCEEGNIYAEHYDENGNPDQDIIDLFGTHAIMTPYRTKKASTHAGQCEIENNILSLNPGVAVSGSYNAETVF
jgi:hypothetical protein